MRSENKSSQALNLGADQGGETCDAAKDTQSPRQSSNHRSWVRDSLPIYTNRIAYLNQKIFGENPQKYLSSAGAAEAHLLAHNLGFAWSREEQELQQQAQVKIVIESLVFNG